VIIKAGGSVTVKGCEGELVTAESSDRWGLGVDRHSPSQIGRARLAAGDHVLFDWRIKTADLKENPGTDEVIEIQMGGSGTVSVPFGSNLKIYSGKDIDVQDIRGQVDAFAGLKLNIQNVHCLGNASAGWSMNLDCETMLAGDVEFKSGSDLRFHVADLTSAYIRVKDLGGYWETRIGSGEKSVYLKSGGDVTLVTDRKAEALPPNYILGRIETPPAA